MFALTLFMLVFDFLDGSLCVNLDLCPLWWMIGAGYRGPDKHAEIKTHQFVLAVPTLRLEVEWTDENSMDRLRDRFLGEERG